MLRHANPDAIHRLERPKEGMEEVVPLPRALELVKGDMTPVRRLAEATAIEMVNQVDQDSRLPIDKAKLNDIVLRAAMRLPTKVQNSKIMFLEFVRDLAARTKTFLEIRRVAPNFIYDFETQMRSLEPSVYQLAMFVSEQRIKQPDQRFSTSVWLDVLYGYDLLRAWPVWIPEENRIEIKVTGFQAKSTADPRGVPPEEVRKLPKIYAGQKARADRELGFDADWVVGQMLEEMDPLTRKNVELALRDPDRVRDLMDRMSMTEGTPYQRWQAGYMRSQIAGVYAASLGLDAQAVPNVSLRKNEVDLRFIVDAPNGRIANLSIAEALAYGT